MDTIQSALYTDFTELHSAIHKALRAYHKPDCTPDNALEGLMLVRLKRVAQSDVNSQMARRYAANTVLLEGMDELAPRNQQGVDILRARFLDKQKTRRVALEINLSEDSVNRLQRKAIDQLTQIVWSQEEVCRAEQAKRYLARLQPSSYTTLHGMDGLVTTITDQLVAPAGPALQLLVGIGGIGKTALADRIVRECINQFAFASVVGIYVETPALHSSAQPPAQMFEQVVATLYDALPEMPPLATGQERLARIAHRLKTQPHLVWIDNLEESADVAYLLEHLGEWVQPSKFIITSRAQPLVSRAAAVHKLNQLAIDDALALLRGEARARGLTALADAPAAELHPIYEITGGNPLALKLTVGLATVAPLSAIIADLRRGLTESTQAMYQRIYWRAWQSLSDDGKELLETMPLANQAGAKPEELQRYSGLDEASMWQAIHELSARSLLEVRGSLHEKRYGIHQLTRTFLHTDIIGWGGETNGNSAE